MPVPTGAPNRPGGITNGRAACRSSNRSKARNRLKSGDWTVVVDQRGPVGYQRMMANDALKGGQRVGM
ncbi:MAG: hypothetical protein ACOX6B_05310 [Thermoguttaceae bacterium]